MKGLSELNTNWSGLCQGLMSAIAQIRVHKAMCHHWGYERLLGKLNEVLQSRSFLLDDLMAAMLACEEVPDLQGLARLNIGQTVEEILQSERKLSSDLNEFALDVLMNWKAHDLHAIGKLEKLCSELHSHILLFDKDLELIRQMGVQNFLATRC